MGSVASLSFESLLKEVSRSFYLTVRVLPAAIRPQVRLAYLLARATDTIADTDLVPVSRRLETLDGLRQRILGKSARPLDLSALIRSRAEQTGAPHADHGPARGSQAETRLLGRVEEMAAACHAFEAGDRQRIQAVLSIITSGQELDLKRFGQAAPNRLAALQTELELDDYAFRVAGCVGEFWTRLCRAHLFPRARLDEAALVAQGICFGKGLQLVNILRDLASDLQLGRCYLPQTALAQHGLAPSDLLVPANETKLRPVYRTWLDQARSHLETGWRYTCALPRPCARVRLACAWPILIGIKTLGRLEQEPVLDPGHRIKITRSEVRAIVCKSLILLPWPSAWAAQFKNCSSRRAQ